MIMEHSSNQNISGGAINGAPVIPVLAPIKEKFENYDERSNYFLDIDEQIRLRLKQIRIAKSQSATNPTASQEAYTELIAINENEIAVLEQQKADMMSGETRH